MQTEEKKTIQKLSPDPIDQQAVINQQIESLAEFFCGKRKKINIWTYLFKEVQLSIDRILRMCEIEQKVAFCHGVRETLKMAIKSLDKIEHKIKLEQNEQKMKNCAWDVTFVNSKSLDQLLVESGFEQNFIDLIESEEESIVEFKLLNELVNEGKMNVLQAIVLIIRERARIFEEMDQKNEKLGNSGVGFQESIPIKNLRGNSTPQSALTLLNRVNWKVKFTDVANDEDKNMQLEKQINEKQVMAQKRKSLISQQRQRDLKKHSSRVNKVKNQRNILVQQKFESILKKEENKIKKEVEKLEEIKSKASANNMQPSEVSFLMLLEKQKQNIQDPKLLQTTKKRQKIIEELNEKRRSEAEKQSQKFLSRREMFQQERKEKVMKIQMKLQQAEERRKLFLEQKAKQPVKSGKKKEPVSVQYQNKKLEYFMATILPWKDKLDYLFESIEENQKRVKRIEDNVFRSNSCDLGYQEISQEIELSENEEKKTSKKRRKKKKTSKIEIDSINEKKQLTKYYKFLTKDLEFLEYQKKAKKKQQQNFTLQQSQPELLEYAELISKEVAKSEKNSSQRMFQYCSLCKTLVEEFELESHLQSQKHLKKSQNGYQESSISLINEQEYNSQKLFCLKRRCKKIKRNIEGKALENEKIFMKNENITSENKKRLTKLILDLDVQVSQQKRDYDQIERVMTEIHKILDKYNEQDLHVLRVSRFVNVFIEFIKTSHICPKYELPEYIKILDNHFVVMSRFALLQQNRQFMFLTNKIVPIIELLSWSWSHSIPSLSLINYIPQLLELLSFLIQHPLSEEFIIFKKLLLEYICYSGLIKKIKLKFTSLQLNEDSPIMIQIVIKTVKFLECLTSEINKFSEIMKKMYNNILQNMLFIFEETEVAGCIHLLASILLSGGSFDRTIKELSNSSLIISYSVLKILNNLAGIDLNSFQNNLGKNSFLVDQFYHIVLFLFAYCKNNYGKVQDVYQVLQELFQVIGYFCLNNKHNQNLLSRGTEKHTIVFKLGSLPQEFYSNNFLLRELMFPTILSVIDNNKINVNIILKVLTKEFILEYIEEKLMMISQEQYEQESMIIINKIIDQTSSSINLFLIEPEKILLTKRFPVSRLGEIKQFLLKIDQQNYLSLFI